MILGTVLQGWLPRLAINAAYKAVFDSPDGVRVMRDLMIRGGLLETSAVEGDPHMTHFNEGRRSLVLDILKELRWSETDIAELARERDQPPPQMDAA